jgi:uncharacterized membrane protein
LRVDAAPEAYSRLALPLPDAFLGLVSYAVTAGLAALGGADRLTRWSFLPVALGVKTLVDAVQAGKLSREQWVRHRRFCFWCPVAATSTFVALPLALPESWSALRQVRGERRP